MGEHGLLHAVIDAPPEDQELSPEEEAKLAKAWADSPRGDVRQRQGGGNHRRLQVGGSG
jgi:hypothetical protein